MMEFVALLLAIATFAFASYPLFFRKQSPVAAVGNDELKELYSKRNTTYSMLKELEFDYNSGILTEEDYKDLEARYKKKAISILKGIDDQSNASSKLEMAVERQIQSIRQRKGASDLDAEIEGKVKQLRQKRKTPADTDAEIERQVAVLRRGQTQFCPQCGVNSREGDRFCRRCGTKLD
jgi:ribosomal protein L40E